MQITIFFKSKSQRSEKLATQFCPEGIRFVGLNPWPAQCPVSQLAPLVEFHSCAVHDMRMEC